MRALVIGGTRFLGKALVADLVNAKFEVSVLNRGTHDIHYPAGVEHLRGDRTDSAKMRQLLEGKYWDVVYDLICNTPETALANTILFKDKTTRLVFLSSTFVYSYGQNLHEEQFDGANYPIPPKISGLGTTESRRVIEAILAQKSPFKTLAVRLPFVFGEDDPTLKLHKLIRRILFKENIHLPNTAAKISVIHVIDAAKSILRLGLYPHEGSVNVAAENPVQISGMIKLIEEATYCSLRKTDEVTSDTISAFSIKSDWFVDTNRLRSFEATARNSGAWLPQLIQDLSRAIYKEKA